MLSSSNPGHKKKKKRKNFLKSKPYPTITCWKKKHIGWSLAWTCSTSNWCGLCGYWVPPWYMHALRRHHQNGASFIGMVSRIAFVSCQFPCHILYYGNYSPVCTRRHMIYWVDAILWMVPDPHCIWCLKIWLLCHSRVKELLHKKDYEQYSTKNTLQWLT